MRTLPWATRRRTAAVAAISALCLTGAVACGGSAGDSGSTGDNGDLATLRLQNCVSVLQVAVAPLFIGDQLGFFAEEGIAKVEVANSSGSTAQCVQLTAAGQADFTSPVPDLLLNSLGQGVDPGVKCVYNLIRRPTAAFMVDPDSGIDSFADLAGAKVGVHALNSAYIPLFEAALREYGVDPGTVEYQVTGYGAQVIDALQTKKVDVALYWDYEAAGYPAMGYNPKILELPDKINNLFSSCIAFNKDYVTENPDLVAGYLRALTKTLIFADENPEAAVRLFWKAAPETKPTGMSEEEALDQAVAVLESRLANVLPSDDDPDPRFGAWASAQQWVDYAAFLGLPEDLDVASLYTTEFIDAANDIDVDEVRAFAKSYEVED